MGGKLWPTLELVAYSNEIKSDKEMKNVGINLLVCVCVLLKYE